MEIIKNRAIWNKAFGVDVYFTYEYFELYAKHYNVDFEGILFEDGSFWTHLIRDIDCTTPYGYGGPINLTKENHEDYKEYALEQGYISELVRFHPILENHHVPFEVQYINDVVIVDLNLSFEEIKANMSKNNRNRISQALRRYPEYVITEHPTEGELNEFMMLYDETMIRNGASKKYFFTFDFIKDHFNLLDSIFIYAKDATGNMASAAIFMHGDEYLHYHLAANDYSLKNPPPKGVLWKAIEWGKGKGLKKLMLGGGKGKNDSLFAFKKGFSDIIKPFYVSKIIFNQEKYDELCSIVAYPNFPAYRKGGDTIV